MSRDTQSAQAGARSVWGLLAEFDSVEALLRAVEQVREDGFTRFDAYSPIPVHGLDEAMGVRSTRLPLLVLGGGASGLGLALLMQWWMNKADYPYLISGKPLFALPQSVPIAFELTVLLAAIGAVVGLFIANGWPEYFHPLLATPRFRRVTSDRFFVAIEASDARFHPDRTRALLEALGALSVEEVEA